MKGSPVGLLEGAFSANSSFGGLFFTEEELSLDRNRVPKHVAIIMDGNRKDGPSPQQVLMMGHWRGAEAITESRPRCEASWSEGPHSVCLFD